MALSLAGGALLSGFINVVIDRFLTMDTVNRVLGKKLGSDLVERLKISLLAAEVVLDDAEYKQLGDERVKEWLNSVRDAVYDADDLLDAVLTKAAAPKKEVSSFLPNVFLNRDRKMVDKMEDVVRRIEFLVKQRDILGLQRNTKDSSLSLSWRESTSLVEGNIYGREVEQQALVKTLTDNSDCQLSVIPIVGMGGVGKTTLAKWLFNVTNKGFELRAWVCVSETFNNVEITKTIIGQLDKSACPLSDLNSLQNKLKEILSKKKFFIVLDDVWSNDGDLWKKFKTPFQYGDKESTILVTTRLEEVASRIQTCPSHFLNELSDHHCWSVFANNAGFPESNGSQVLEKIGREIVDKCKGIPLAAETLGRMLHMKHEVKDWEAVLKSDIWEFSVENSKIVPALLISYFHLPAHLKCCFVYCSLYPKDYCFNPDDLILLWMAEGFLRPTNGGESLEEVGCKCFEELASRLFFKPHKTSFKRFVMHDLIHDLALFLAGDFYGRLEHGEAKGVTPFTRHLSCQDCSDLIYKKFDSPKSLRTLITFFHLGYKTDSEACSLILKLKYLRVLSFNLSEIPIVLPNSIGKLTSLRYLDLSYTGIKTLPESLCNLYNLQTLKLENCYSLTMLPNGMHKLVNLRHLNIKGTNLKEMPGGMSKLKELRILGYFIVGKHKDNGIQELGGLLNLHGSLEIRKLENVVDVKLVKGARIADKKHIDGLRLKWSSDDMVSKPQTEGDILENLQPHNGLKELKIKGYKGTGFPDWLGHFSYQNMTSVSLVRCKNCCKLPSLGQLPSLKSLCVKGFDQLKSVGMEFYKN